MVSHSWLLGQLVNRIASNLLRRSGNVSKRSLVKSDGSLRRFFQCFRPYFPSLVAKQIRIRLYGLPVHVHHVCCRSGSNDNGANCHRHRESSKFRGYVRRTSCSSIETAAMKLGIQWFVISSATGLLLQLQLRVASYCGSLQTSCILAKFSFPTAIFQPVAQDSRLLVLHWWLNNTDSQVQVDFALRWHLWLS